MLIAPENLIKRILSEELFGNRLCESIEEFSAVNMIYNYLYESKLLFGEPISVPELRKILRQKIVNFQFIKLDGEIRNAVGTTMMSKIPQKDHPKGIRPSSHKVATFFDLKKKAWRSVSQRSKEIVLKKDEFGRPIVVVSDKRITKLEIGSTYDFTKISKNRRLVPTYITITRKDKEGYWGLTAGSAIEILVNEDRMKRVGNEIKIGDTYEFKKLDKNKNPIFTTIEITKKDDDGYWGKTEGSDKEILLTNIRLKRLGQNIETFKEEDPKREEPTKEEKPIEKKPEEEPKVLKVEPEIKEPEVEEPKEEEPEVEEPKEEEPEIEEPTREVIPIRPIPLTKPPEKEKIILVPKPQIPAKEKPEEIGGEEGAEELEK